MRDSRKVCASLSHAYLQCVQDAASADSAVPAFNAGRNCVPNSGTRRKKVVVRKKNRTIDNSDDRRDISGEDRNSNAENDVAMEVRHSAHRCCAQLSWRHAKSLVHCTLAVCTLQ